MKDDDRKPNDPKESQRRGNSWRKAIVGSQFAYTLVIATLLMGWIGHWLGSLLGGTPWTVIFMLLFGGAGFAAEMWRMLKFFSTKDDDNDGPGAQSGEGSGTKFGVRRNDRMPDDPGVDSEGGPFEEGDRRDNDDIERGGGEPERRGGDDIERPGEADDRPFRSGGSPFGNLPGDGLSRDELDEIIREIEGLTKVERQELDRELGSKPDGSPAEDGTPSSDSSAKPRDEEGKDKK